MGCHGLHCDGCRHGSGGPAAAAAVLLIFLAVAVRAEWHVIAATVELIAWCLLGTAAAATAGIAAVLAVRARRARRDRIRQQAATVLLAPGRYHVIPPAPPASEPARRAAIEAPRPRLHVVPGGAQQACPTSRRRRR
jgi:hypothetical protein